MFYIENVGTVSICIVLDSFKKYALVLCVWEWEWRMRINELSYSELSQISSFFPKIKRSNVPLYLQRENNCFFERHVISHELNWMRSCRKFAILFIVFTVGFIKRVCSVYTLYICTTHLSICTESAERTLFRKPAV